MPKPRILFVEEDPVMLRGISWLLRDQGYDVVALSAAGDISSIVERRSPDLILLDLDARGHDNHRLLARIRSDRRWFDIPLLTMGSDPRQAASERNGAQTSGPVVSDFIPKPLRVAELLARVQAQLRMRSVLRTAFDSLRTAEKELQRTRTEAETRREIVDILTQLGSELSSEEVLSLLTGRLLSALDAHDCFVLVAHGGDRIGHVVALAGDSTVRLGPASLENLPEVVAALEHDRVVLVEDVNESGEGRAAERVRRPEARAPRIRSSIAVPFSMADVTHSDESDSLRTSGESRVVTPVGSRAQGRREAGSGVIVVRRSFDQPPFDEQSAELARIVIAAGTSAVQRARAVERVRADNARLEALAQTDPLTRVLNRRGLVDRLTAELDRAMRYDSIVSLLMVDVDYFKAVNDTYGHLAGDEALRWVAQVLQGAVRSVDMVARYGGEEFAVVLPETTSEGAVVFADRIRERIELGRVRFNGAQIQITASIGVATFPSGRVRSLQDMLALADEALYRAKAAGRNAVRL